jgi:hypothetical protein
MERQRIGEKGSEEKEKEHLTYKILCALCELCG